MNVILYIILGIILFTVGKTFFDLAGKYRKNKLVFTTVGVFSFIIGVVIYILIYAQFIDVFPHFNRYIHEFLSFATGILIAFLVYYLLRKKWKN